MKNGVIMNNSASINISKKKKEYVLLTVSFLYFAVSNISRMLELIGIGRVFPYIIFFSLFIIFAIRSLSKLKMIDIAIYAVITVIFAYGLSHYSTYIASSLNVLSIFAINYPAYYYFKLCDDDYIEKGARYSSVFSTVYLLFYYFVIIRPKGWYDMNYAYWIATPLVLQSYYFFKDGKKINLFASLIMLFTLFISGCRGALLLAIISLGYLYFFGDIKKQKKITIGIVLLTIVVIAFININTIAEYLGAYSSTSRNIQKLLSGDFFDSASRENVYNYAKHLIELKPTGYGPLASRKLISFEPYPHSIYYEMQLDYGRILGSLAVFIIMAMGCYNLFYYRKTKLQGVVAVVTIMGLFSLIISGSYFYEAYVPANIALFVKAISAKRPIKNARYKRNVKRSNVKRGNVKRDKVSNNRGAYEN